MKIQIFGSKEKDPDTLSKLIMEKLDCGWSHNGIIFGDKIYHAVGKGVCTVSQEEFLEKREYAVLIDITDKVKKSHDALLGFLEGRLGTEYSSSQYLGFIFPELQKHIKNGSEKVVCSELAYEFAVFAGVLEQGHFENQDYVDPKMIIEALRQQ